MISSRTLSYFIVIAVFGVQCSTKTDVSDKPRHAYASPPIADSNAVIPLGTGTRYKFKGLAIDGSKQRVYLGSWDKKEIVKISLTSGKSESLKSPYNGRLNGMGCFIKNGILYAVMNEVDDTPGTEPISVLALFDLTNDQLIRSYELKGKNGRNHFNHVVVDDDGIAYISNTLKSSIIYVDTKNVDDHLKVLVEHKDLSFVHGLDVNADNSMLFTTSYSGGIRFFNLKSRTFSPFRDTTITGNDGLRYHNGFLYGVGQNTLTRYELDNTQRQILRAEVIMKNHEFFNDPRCLHVEGNELYCLANIEFDPVAFPGNSGTRVMPLTDSYLIKLRIRD